MTKIPFSPLRFALLVCSLLLAGAISAADQLLTQTDGVAEHRLIREVRELLREHEKEHSPEAIIAFLNNVAKRRRDDGRIAAAITFAEVVLDYADQLRGRNDPRSVTSIGVLAKLYLNEGRHMEAEPLCRRLVSISEEALGSEDPSTLTFVYWLARTLRALGRYGEAEPLYRRVLSGRERVLGADHPDTLSSMNNLALLYESQERSEEAEALHKRVLTASERVLGAENPDLLQTLVNLATLYKSQKRYEEAERLYQRALAIVERALRPEDPYVLVALNNLATFYLTQNRLSEADPLLRRVEQANERVLGADHPQTLLTLANLASLYDSQGRHDEAQVLLQRAMSGLEKTHGMESPTTIGVHMNLAINLVRQGQIGAAVEQLRSLDQRLRGFVGEQLRTSESLTTRRLRLASEKRFQHAVFTLARDHPGEETVSLAADVLLGWKRLIGEEDAVVARLVRESTDPGVLKLADELRHTRAELATLASLASATEEAVSETLRTKREELQRNLGRLEIELAGISRAFRDHHGTSGADWRAVAAALPSDSALLELRMYKPIDFSNGTFGELHWLALLLPADADRDRPPRIFDLGPAGTGLAHALMMQWGDPRFSSRAYETLFGRIDEEIKAFSTLLIATDMVLDMVAFAQMRVPDGRYWVERQTLRVVRSGRDLLGARPRSEVAGMVALGGIDYERFAEPDSGTGTPASERDAQPSFRPSASADATAGITSAMNERLRARGVRFGVLEHTGPEARSVGRFYWDDLGRKAKVLTGLAATEASLKALDRPPRILHLATHGFFLGFFLDSLEDQAERPMTQSGVALAGANRGLQGERDSSDQDGILYAIEAQGLDLEGTELVTLSACDTGRGSVDDSEGVYGLVRAFHIAGARSVLISLWSLDDRLTRAFMDDFYGYLFDPDGYDHPAEALRATQLEWINHGDEQRRNPRYWAPFVLIEQG
jgi:tetratricopeptide (TPR) repeat protein